MTVSNGLYRWKCSVMESYKRAGWGWLKVSDRVRIQVHPDRDCTSPACPRYDEVHRHAATELTFWGEDKK